MLHKLIYYISIGLFCAFVFGCNAIPDCTNDVERNEVTIQFLNTSDSTTLDLSMDSISALNAVPLFIQDTTLSKYDLELDPSRDTTTYLFFWEANQDTLQITYDRFVSIVSEQCGPTIGFESITIVKHSFDSASVTNDFLNILLSENIEIYN